MRGVIIVLAPHKRGMSQSEIFAQQSALVTVTKQKALQVYNKYMQNVPSKVHNEDGTTTHYVRVGARFIDENRITYFIQRFFPHELSVKKNDKIVFFGANWNTVTVLNGEPIPPFIVTVNQTNEFNLAVLLPYGGTDLTSRGILNLGLLDDPSVEVTVTAKEVGTFDVVCLMHYDEMMKAQVIVTE